MTMAIFGGVIIVLNLITFATTRERVLPPPGQKSSLREDVKNVLTSRPWLVLFFLTLLIFTMLVVRGSSSNYFFAYYMDQQSIRAFLETFGLGVTAGTATGGNAVLNALGLLVRPDGSNAAAVGLSPNYFRHLFKKVRGQGFKDHLNAVRIEKARTLLATGGHKVYEVAQMVGFSDYKYFSAVFKKLTGTSPTRYR